MLARFALRPTAAVLVVALAACTVVGPSEPATSTSPGASPSAPAGSTLPSPTQSPGVSPSGVSPSGGLTEAAAKYRLTDAVGRPFFCDPDVYPVARADETDLAAERLPEIRADTATFAAITARLGVDAQAGLSAEQRLAVYRQWKILRAIALTETAGGWTFDVAIGTESEPGSGQRVAGTIGRDGVVHVASRTAAGILSCPICLARGTTISTPGGAVRVEALRLGDPVWTFDAAGRVVRGRVVALGSTPVPPAHEMVRLVLSDGRAVEASPGHPLLDGRPIGSLRPGDAVDGASVVSVARQRYVGGATYDLLASGSSGGYLAGGVPLGSTIDR